MSVGNFAAKSADDVRCGVDERLRNRLAPADARGRGVADDAGPVRLLGHAAVETAAPARQHVGLRPVEGRGMASAGDEVAAHASPLWKGLRRRQTFADDVPLTMKRSSVRESLKSLGFDDHPPGHAEIMAGRAGA